MGTIHNEYLFSPGIQLPHILAAIKYIRQYDTEDKNMCAKQVNETKDQIQYEVQHKMPEIMRVFLNIPSIDMIETINISLPDSKIICKIVPKNINKSIMFTTLTTYMKVGDVDPSKNIKYTNPNQVFVQTQIVLKIPFKIPEAVKPLIVSWAKKKTKKIRKMESKYARLSILSVKKNKT